MGNQFSDHTSMPLSFGRVYWVVQMGRIHRTPHLAHVVLLSVISSSHNLVRLSTATIYQYIQYSVSACYKLVIASSQLRNKNITFILLYLFLCLFSYVLFQLYSILHDHYISSTDAYVRYIFSSYALYLLVMQVQVLNIQITHRSISRSLVQQIQW